MTRAVWTALTSIATLGLAACGGPAPGEGMESEMAPEPMPEIVPADEAIRTAAIPDIDPERMQEAEIDKVLPAGARCTFSYTAAGRPVLAGAPAERGKGVVKIHGRLVALEVDATSIDALAGPTEFRAEGMRLTVRPLEEAGETIDPDRQRKAEMRFEIKEGLTVGYRGWYRCRSSGA
ncbi:DUF6692 family protein [Parvularcula oceani]|uniref:DUF6692 family protein n=1 Tax=Parvularcula oceani TaxID=1247963 RepID=UPI00307B2853